MTTFETVPGNSFRESQHKLALGANYNPLLAPLPDGRSLAYMARTSNDYVALLGPGIVELDRSAALTDPAAYSTALGEPEWCQLTATTFALAMKVVRQTDPAGTKPGLQLFHVTVNPDDTITVSSPFRYHPDKAALPAPWTNSPHYGDANQSIVARNADTVISLDILDGGGWGWRIAQFTWGGSAWSLASETLLATSFPVAGQPYVRGASGFKGMADDGLAIFSFSFYDSAGDEYGGRPCLVAFDLTATPVELGQYFAPYADRSAFETYYRYLSGAISGATASGTVSAWLEAPGTAHSDLDGTQAAALREWSFDGAAFTMGDPIIPPREVDRQGLETNDGYITIRHVGDNLYARIFNEAFPNPTSSETDPALNLYWQGNVEFLEVRDGAMVRLAMPEPPPLPTDIESLNHPGHNPFGGPARPSFPADVSAGIIWDIRPDGADGFWVAGDFVAWFTDSNDADTNDDWRSYGAYRLRAAPSVIFAPTLSATHRATSVHFLGSRDDR